MNEGDTKVLKKGDMCPRFVFKDVNGKEVSLAQYLVCL